jgi:hypothetical protein
VARRRRAGQLDLAALVLVVLIADLSLRMNVLFVSEDS